MDSIQADYKHLLNRFLESIGKYHIPHHHQLQHGLKEGYQVRRGQREGWLRLTIPMAQDGAVMRGILKQFMN